MLDDAHKFEPQIGRGAPWSGKKTKNIRDFGGAEGNRTPDLCSAIAALSHLSYSPAPERVFRARAHPCQSRRRKTHPTRNLRENLFRRREGLNIAGRKSRRFRSPHVRRRTSSSRCSGCSTWPSTSIGGSSSSWRSCPGCSPSTSSTCATISSARSGTASTPSPNRRCARFAASCRHRRHGHFADRAAACALLHPDGAGRARPAP